MKNWVTEGVEQGGVGVVEGTRGEFRDGLVAKAVAGVVAEAVAKVVEEAVAGAMGEAVAEVIAEVVVLSTGMFGCIFHVAGMCSLASLPIGGSLVSW